MEIPGADQKRVASLDGLRGLAILLVVAGHYFPEVDLLAFGWIGLNLFFVLSGYLITSRLTTRYQYASHDLPDFYKRRFLRIFPLYYGVLIFFFLLLPVVLSGYDSFYGSLYERQAWYWTFTSNVMIILKGLPHSPVFFHFWSLAVEEQFYVVWPLVLWASWKARVVVPVLVLLLGLSITWRLMGQEPLHTYISTLTAAEPLLLGCLVAVLQQRGYLLQFKYPVMILGLVSMIFLVLGFIRHGASYENYLGIGYSAINLSWVFILVISVLKVRQASVVFELGWLRWLGRYSYGIYVFHYIILNVLVYTIGNKLVASGIDTTGAYLLSRFGGITLVLLVSVLSYQVYERRFLRMR